MRYKTQEKLIQSYITPAVTEGNTLICNVWVIPIKFAFVLKVFLLYILFNATQNKIHHKSRKYSIKYLWVHKPKSTLTS